MTNILDLFRGVGVIIDDALNPENPKRNDDIWKIKKSFEEKNIPLSLYYTLPNKESIVNFNSICFILLDWDLFELSDEDVLKGIMKPDTSIQNINFIKDFNKVCFAPIFIFSKENPETIKRKLADAGLYIDSKNNNIFVESKGKVKQAKTLFSKINRWLKDTPSIYALKEWEKSLQQAKNSLFLDFYKINPNFPAVLQQAFTTDGVDENHELGTLIYKNLIARTTPMEFDKNIIPIFDLGKKGERTKEQIQNLKKYNRFIKNVSKDDLRKILECERYLKKENLSDSPAAGDIFKHNSTYLINIRPDCDIVRKGNNVKLYCLKGNVVKEQNINAKKKSNKVTFEKGNFIEKVFHAYVSFVDDGKIIEFKFNDNNFIQEDWQSIKDNRIGRLLPPYITRLQQKYAFYLQRQGLPAIPEKAIR